MAEIYHSVYLGLGSNMGNRLHMLQQAILLLNELGTITEQSSIIETDAWGNTEQDSFLNCAVKLLTPLQATDLLIQIQQIESKLGRVRLSKWGPRTIDIDILLFDMEMINEKKLQIPHPLMHQRHFVLKPLSEIAPNVVHPILQQTITELYKNLLKINRE